MEVNRIHTFDIVRAIAITLMILAHVHNAWLDAASQWMEGLLYCILSPMGVPGFVLVSGLSFGFSWENNVNKGMDYKKNFNYQLPRTIILIGVAVAYNLAQLLMNINNYVSNNVHPWFLGSFGVICNIWYWSILFTLGFSRLFAAYAMKINKIGRIILSIVLILITPVIIDSLEAVKNTSIIAESLYWILFNNITQDSIVMFFPCFLIGSVLGQEICSQGKTNSFINLKKLLVLGIILFVTGILVGLNWFEFFADRMGMD
jgi:peptidoglycan/LPS O-acetylase OafA/YrhL